MIEKIDNRNFLKTWIGFIIAAVVAFIGSAVVLWVDFYARVSTLLSNASASGATGHHGEDGEYIFNNLAFTTTDKVIIGIVIALVVALAVTYWVFMIESIIKQTRKDGTNTRLFGWLTGFFNILAVAGYFIYRCTLIKCPACGKLQPRKSTIYCRYCGTAVAKECKGCGTRMKLDENFCHNCGKASL